MTCGPLMAISPAWPVAEMSRPSSSRMRMYVLGMGTPMVPENSVAVTGLQLAEGLVSERP